jgi:plasmid stability protein
MRNPIYICGTISPCAVLTHANGTLREQALTAPPSSPYRPLTSAGGAPVPTLTVRRVDASIARRLRVRAAEQDVSAEELHRRILANALGDGKTVADLVGTLRRMGELGLDLDRPTPEGPERESPRL